MDPTASKVNTSQKFLHEAFLRVGIRGPRWLKQCLLVLQSRAAAYMARGNEEGVVRSHLMIEGCDSYVTTRCHVMPCEYEALSRRREPLTGQGWRRGVLSPRVNTQPVSHTRFTPSPLLTHFTFTIYTHTHSRSFDLIIPQVSKLLFCTQSNFGLTFFFFSFNLVCCTHLVFILPLPTFTSSLFYITHFLCMFLCLLSKRSPLFFARFSLGVYSMRCAPFDCHLLRLAVFFFFFLYPTFASHGNRKRLCYSPAFRTCGFACLAGRQATLSGSVCLCRCRTLRTHRPVAEGFFSFSFFFLLRGFSEQPYPAVL